MDTAAEEEVKAELVVDALGLEKLPSGYYDSIWGEKNALGIYRGIKQIMRSDAEELLNQL